MATDLNQLIANPELAGFERQRRMAEMLVQRGQKTPQGQMIGNIYVGASPWEFLGNMAQQYVGENQLKDIDQQELALAKALREKKLLETTDIMKSLTGAPEVATELAGPAYQGVTPQAIMPAIPANPQEALAKALKSETGAGNVLLPSIIQNVIPKKTDKLIEYDTYTREGGTKKFTDWSKEITPAEQARLDIDRQRLGLEGTRVNLEKQKLEQELVNGKPLTEFQGKATNFGIQMAGSMKEMKAVENSGFNPTSTKNQALLAVSGTSLGNMFASPEAQRYKQAMDNFTENFIRFKSGANVPMHEIEKDLKNMMPQTGDTPDKIEQKQRARERALEGMAISAGPGVKHIVSAYSVEAPGMKGATPNANAQSTPSAWGKATVVEK